MQFALLCRIPSRVFGSLLGVLFFLGSTALATTAAANTNGLDGETGKPIAGAAHRCGECHTGGTAPTVAFAGPASLAAGQTGSYTLTVNTGSQRVGGAVAVTPDVNDNPADPVTLVPGTNMKTTFNEVVHAGTGVASSGGKVTFSFSFVAPKAGGTVKLWGVGLATNNNGAKSGDADALTTMNVTIVGPPPVLDAGVKDSGGFVPSDSGSGTSDGGSSGGPGGDDASVSPGVDSGQAAGNDSGTPDLPDEGLPTNNSGGCSVASIGAGAGALGVDGGALAASFLTMLGLVAAVGARRRRD